MTFPFRKRVYACIHPQTYKYFLAPDRVDPVWNRLAQVAGEPKQLPGFGIFECQAESALLRAGPNKNPITVIRQHGFCDEHLERLHKLLEFTGGGE